MRTKSARVTRVRRATSVVKRGSCLWSIHRELAFVGIQGKTLRISGSRPFRLLKMHNKSLHRLSNSFEGTRKEFNKHTRVTSRHIRPLTLLQRRGYVLSEANKRCIFHDTQGLKALSRLMKDR